MEKITLNEYKSRVNNFLKKVKEKLLVDCEENEIYQASSYFRNDLVNDLQKHLYSRVLKKYDNVRGFIETFNDNIASEDCEAKDFEYLSDGCFYKVCKYRLMENDEFEKVFTLTIVNSEDCLEFTFNIGMKSYFTSIEQELYDEWEKLSNLCFQRECRLELEFPFSKGDIIGVSGKPFQCYNQYYVYCNSSGKCISRDFFERLSVKDLFSYCENIDYKFFVPYYAKKVEACEDKVLNNLSKLISESSDEEIEELLGKFRRLPEEDWEEFDIRIQNVAREFEKV